MLQMCFCSHGTHRLGTDVKQQGHGQQYEQSAKMSNNKAVASNMNRVLRCQTNKTITNNLNRVLRCQTNKAVTNNLNKVLRIRTDSFSDSFSCSEKTQKIGVNYLLKQQWQSGVMHCC